MDPSQGPIVAAFFPSGGTFTSAMRLASSTAVAWDGVADPLEPGPLLRLRSSLRPGDDGDHLFRLLPRIAADRRRLVRRSASARDSGASAGRLLGLFSTRPTLEGEPQLPIWVQDALSDGQGSCQWPPPSPGSSAAQR